MYIGHDVAGGSGRAAIVRPAGERARAAKEDRVYLGRVVDRTRGIYRSGCQGPVPLRPGDGQVQAHAGGIERPRRRDARTQLPSHQLLA